MGAVALVALATTGCGKDADPPDLAKSLREGAQLSSAAPSLRLSFNAVIDDKLQAHTEFAGVPNGDGSGVVQNSEHDVAFLVVRDDFYLAPTDLPAGKKWIGLSPSELASIGIVSSSGDERDPQQALGLLGAARNPVETIGTESLAGVATTHYRCTIDVKALVTQTSSPFTADGATRLSGLLGDAAVIDAWLGDDGRIHRIRYGVDLTKSPARPDGFPATGRLAYQYDFSDYGRPFPVEAPSPDAEMTLAEYKELHPETPGVTGNPAASTTTTLPS